MVPLLDQKGFALKVLIPGSLCATSVFSVSLWLMNSEQNTPQRHRADPRIRAVSAKPVQTSNSLGYNPLYDIIRSNHIADRGGRLWSVGTGNYRVLARRLPGVHRTGVCRCDYRRVDCSIAGSTGTLSGANRNDQLSNYLVDYRLGIVRRTDRTAYQTTYVGSATATLPHTQSKRVEKAAGQGREVLLSSQPAMPV